MADEIIVTLPKPLEDVETAILLPPDLYKTEFIEVEKRKGPKDEFLNFSAQIYSKEGKATSRCYEIISLAETAEWKLKKVLMAMGMKEPKGRKLDVKKTMLHRPFTAEIIIEEYETTDETTGKKVKKKRNGINDYFPIAQAKKPETKPGEPEPEAEISNGEEVSFG